MIENLFEYFKDTIEYPSSDVLLNGLESDILFEFVDINYLNGIVNYLNIMGGIMLNHYMNYDDFIKACENIDRLKDDHIYTNLYDCKKFDDIILIGIGADSYWILWSNCDCSDCCIGRLSLNTFNIEDIENILLSTGKYLVECEYGPYINNSNQRVKYIPKECFSGWITL